MFRARAPAHGHAELEECLVLEGDILIGGVRFGAGDYHAAFEGTRHPEFTSLGGGVMFVRSALPR